MLRNHIIPQHYQKGFCNKAGVLVRYDVDKNCCVAITPKNNIVLKGYYTSETERYLSERIEGPCNRIINEIRERRFTLTYDDKKILSTYIYSLSIRIPTAKDLFDRLYTPILEKHYSPESIMQSYGYDSISPQALARLTQLKEEQDTPEQRNLRWNDTLQLDRGIIPDILSKMNWSLLLARGTFRFISSDCPVFYSNLKRPWAELTLPLSSEVCLQLSRVEPSSIYVLRNERVHEINKNTARNARYVFGLSKAQLENVFERELTMCVKEKRD